MDYATEATGISDSPSINHEGILRKSSLNSFNNKSGKTVALLIDEIDIPHSFARNIIEAEVKVVINTKKAISSNYPSFGLTYLLDNGLQYYEIEPSDKLEELKDKVKCKIVDNVLQVKHSNFPLGNPLSKHMLSERINNSTSRMVTNLEALSGSAIAYLENQLPAYTDNVGVPILDKKLRTDHAVVCFPGFEKKDLKRITPFVKEFKPTVIAVEAAADTLLEGKVTPSVVLGRAENFSSKILQSDIPIVMPADTEGNIPDKNVVYDFREGNIIPFTVVGGVRDLALLLAGNNVTNLIVTLGPMDDLNSVLRNPQEQFLANMLLTKLNLGARTVDSKYISSLYKTKLSPILFASFILILFVTILVLLLLLNSDGNAVSDYLDNIKNWFSNLRK